MLCEHPHARAAVWNSRQWVASLGLIVVLVFYMAAVGEAQVLDRVIEGLLANNCLTLTGGGGGGTAQPLAGLCAAGPGATSTGPSVGGGASTVQGSAVSILNRRLSQRIEETREEDGRDQKRAAAVQFNPMGALFGASGLGSGVNVPSMQADGTTGGTVNLGTTSRWHGLGFFGSGVVEALN